jgi:hypothetical protein
MPSKWIEFVKEWSKDNNLTYGCAMSKPECKNAYHKKYDTQKYQKERKEKETEQMGAEDKASKEMKKREVKTGYSPIEENLFNESWEKEMEIPNIPLSNEIWKYSDPKKVRKNADKYFGKKYRVFVNDKPTLPGKGKGKKYFVLVRSPKGRVQMIYFGQMGMEDFTKHNDPVRRDNYLSRATNIKGKWKEDKFSPNNLAINLLWS